MGRQCRLNETAQIECMREPRLQWDMEKFNWNADAENNLQEK